MSEIDAHQENAIRSDSSSNDEWDYMNDEAPSLSRSHLVNSIGSAVSEDNLTFMTLLSPGLTVKASKKAFTKVKTRTKRITNRARIEKNKLISRIADEDLVLMKERVFKHINKLDQNLMKTVLASETEKWFYAFALFQIFYIGIILGKYPNYFHLYYSVLFVLLMPIRLYTYWKRDFQFFLADFCYYANLLVMLYIWVFPNLRHLFVVCFSFTFGTLLFAVITWRNSLVLHLIEKITSSFIHIMPPLSLFVITHEIDPDFKAERFSGAARTTSWNLIKSILWSSFYYLIWQLLYHYFITYRQQDKIREGRVNSFTYLRRSYANKPIGKFVNSLRDPFPVFAFTLIQYGYQLGTMLLCPIWLKYKQLAALFLSTIFIVASYNGATYYLDIFGKKLEKEVVRLRQEISELQSESLNSSSSSMVEVNKKDESGEHYKKESGSTEEEHKKNDITIEEHKKNV